MFGDVPDRMRPIQAAGMVATTDGFPDVLGLAEVTKPTGQARLG
jgi:hypothetical protein